MDAVRGKSGSPGEWALNKPSISQDVLWKPQSIGFRRVLFCQKQLDLTRAPREPIMPGKRVRDPPPGAAP